MIHFALFTEFFELHSWAILPKVLLFFPLSKATRRYMVVLNFFSHFLDTSLLLLVMILVGLLLLFFFFWYLPILFLFIDVVELKTYANIKVK